MLQLLLLLLLRGSRQSCWRLLLLLLLLRPCGWVRRAAPLRCPPHCRRCWQDPALRRSA